MVSTPPTLFFFKVILNPLHSIWILYILQFLQKKKKPQTTSLDFD